MKQMIRRPLAAMRSATSMRTRASTTNSIPKTTNEHQARSQIDRQRSMTSSPYVDEWYEKKQAAWGQPVIVQQRRINDPHLKCILNWRWLKHPNILHLFEFYPGPDGRFMHLVYDDIFSSGDQPGWCTPDDAEMVDPAIWHESSTKVWVRHVLLGLRHTHQLGLYYFDFQADTVRLDRNRNAVWARFEALTYVPRQGTVRPGLLSKNERYRAPELKQHCPMDRTAAEKVDVFAVGAWTQEMLTGRSVSENGSHLLGPGTTLEAQDFIARMMSSSPEERLTVREALCHPWLIDRGIAPDCPEVCAPCVEEEWVCRRLSIDREVCDPPNRDGRQQSSERVCVTVENSTPCNAIDNFSKGTLEVESMPSLPRMDDPRLIPASYIEENMKKEEEVKPEIPCSATVTVTCENDREKNVAIPQPPPCSSTPPGQINRRRIASPVSRISLVCAGRTELPSPSCRSARNSQSISCIDHRCRRLPEPDHSRVGSDGSRCASGNVPWSISGWGGGYRRSNTPSAPSTCTLLLPNNGYPCDSLLVDSDLDLIDNRTGSDLTLCDVYEN